MGTTITTNLGLIKPDLNESIKVNGPAIGWAAQNALNCDVEDGLFRNSQHTYAASWLANAVNPTLGAGGFVEGKCVRLFPRMIMGFFRIFTGGAGFAPGTGIYRVTLPASMAAELYNFDDSVVIGKAILLDFDAVATCSNMLVVFDKGTACAFLRPAAGASFFSTNPITLAQNDRVSGYFMYPTSDA